jgi:small subunit ribosomal protein S9
MATTTTDNRTYASGKRKTATARVWIKPGTGKITVNKREFNDYFVRETSRMIVLQPLELVEMADQWDVFVNVSGGGTSAQAEAVRHGIARALCENDTERRPAIKRAGYLTRDSRKVERKKYGQPGARKRFQYSKR